MFGMQEVRPLWPLELLDSRSNAHFAQKMADGRPLFITLIHYQHHGGVVVETALSNDCKLHMPEEIFKIKITTSLKIKPRTQLFLRGKVRSR